MGHGAQGRARRVALLRSSDASLWVGELCAFFSDSPAAGAAGVGATVASSDQYVLKTLEKRSYKTNLGNQAIVNIADVGSFGLASYIPGYEDSAKKLRGSDYYVEVERLYNADGTPVYGSNEKRK